jgi:hypothetical protein
MSAAQILALVLLGPLAVYLVVRLATAAFFKSKATYDQQRTDHGTSPRYK